MSGIDEDAIEALVELGLSTYEARVFAALVRLGEGTARDVASVTDVPRPQVYTTADDLEARGLISTQQSNPQVFRPVSIDEARAQLEQRFEDHRDTAFGHLESIQRTADRDDDRSEDVWSITGEAAVTERIIRLAAAADRTILYGATDLDDPGADLVSTFASARDRGVDVVLFAESDQPVAESLRAVSSRLVRLPAEDQSNEYAERILIADFEVFLLSIRGAETEAETAVWSAETTFARVFSQLIVGSIPDVTHRFDGPV